MWNGTVKTMTYLTRLQEYINPFTYFSALVAFISTLFNVSDRHERWLVQVFLLLLISSYHHQLSVFKMSNFDCHRLCIGTAIRRQVLALTCLILLLTIGQLPFIQSNEVQEIDTQESNSDRSSSETGVEFPPMFVLNLPRSTERWSAAKQQMDEAGLTVQRFDAIDGRTLSKEELRKVSTSLAMFLQPRGVLGCYLSHRAFWQVKMTTRAYIYPTLSLPRRTSYHPPIHPAHLSFFHPNLSFTATFISPTPSLTSLLYHPSTYHR